MSSVGSYSDNERSSNGNSDNGDVKHDGNHNVEHGSNNSGSNINNKDINCDLSPLGFIIEKESCTSIYDIEILDIDLFF